MCLATNITRRGARYHIRVRVPADLVQYLGRREITKSLNTSDPRDAKQLGRSALSKLDRWFEMKRAERDSKIPNTNGLSEHLTMEQQGRAARDYYESLLEDDRRARIVGYSKAEEWQSLRNRSAEMQRIDLGTGNNYVHVHDFADTVYAELGYRVGPSEAEDFGDGCAPYEADTGDIPAALPNVSEMPAGSPTRPLIRRDSLPYRELCQALLRARVEANKRLVGRDAGDYTGKPLDPLITGAIVLETASSSAGQHESYPPPKESIIDLHERYLSERQNISEEWRLTNRAIIRLFADHLGHRTSPSTISKKHIIGWKDALMKYPSRGSLRDPSASFQEIIKLNEHGQRPTLTIRTINKYLSAVGSFMDWLVKNELAQQNPVMGVYLNNASRHDRRDPFTIDQLNRLFGSPLFAGCLSADPGMMHRPGKLHIRNHRYWLPILALWTGARLGELCQLLVGDIVALDGVECLNITPEGDKHLKNFAAKRFVPIHSELRRLGFLEFVAHRKGSKAERLFQEIKLDSLGRISSGYSKWFSNYLRRIDVKVDARVSFHSFRHTFVDAMRTAGFNDSVVGIFVGHSNNTVTAGYGEVPQFTPLQRHEIIDKVRYSGLDLTNHHEIA